MVDLTLKVSFSKTVSHSVTLLVHSPNSRRHIGQLGQNRASVEHAQATTRGDHQSLGVDVIKRPVAKPFWSGAKNQYHRYDGIDNGYSFPAEFRRRLGYRCQH